MKLVKVLALLVSCTSGAVNAQAKAPHISDVLTEATAITTLRDGSILVAKKDGAYLCFVDVVDLYSQVLVEGRPEIVRQPSAICTSVDVFKNLGDR